MALLTFQQRPFLATFYCLLFSYSVLSSPCRSGVMYHGWYNMTLLNVLCRTSIDVYESKNQDFVADSLVYLFHQGYKNVCKK